MKKDKFCLYITRRNGCRKLTVEKCLGKSCSFVQSIDQVKASHKKSFERLASLDKKQQRHIADKYYAGKMPWIEGGVEE